MRVSINSTTRKTNQVKKGWYASLKDDLFRWIWHLGQEPTKQQEWALLALVDSHDYEQYVVKPEMQNTNIPLTHLIHDDNLRSFFQIETRCEYPYISLHHKSSKQFKTYQKNKQKDVDEMTWDDMRLGLHLAAFAEVRKENGQGGTLCFQEAAITRAKREHDQMMPQRFNCFFRRTATDHTQARQQARGDGIMMRHCIQNLWSSCAWRIHFSCMMESVTPHSRRRHPMWNLPLVSCCHIVVLEQDGIPSKSEGRKGEHQQSSIPIYPIASDLRTGFCTISAGWNAKAGITCE